MSLVEAGIDDDGRVIMVADTKVTWPQDEARGRHPFKSAVPKIVILRPDLAVGLTGEDPERVLEDLVSHRDSDVADLLDHLTTLPQNGFVVAALQPPRLVWVGDGKVEERSSPPRAWDGDSAGHERFRSLELDWGDGVSLGFKLMSSMDSLVQWGQVASVGGFSLAVTGSDQSGFRFVPREFTVFPDLRDATLTVDDEKAMSISASFDASAGSSVFQARIVPGSRSTPGALGIWVPGAETGLVFAEDSPHVRIKLEASSFSDFLDLAAGRGQSLDWPSN
ncbi:hypothetical protein [Curtobacterium flaccumfaciens]|uniref:hypothetical protein n=1 Tax=Curtobacterium flaccumfaciens TaxID=2035 RepID=UPI003D9A1E9D